VAGQSMLPRMVIIWSIVGPLIDRESAHAPPPQATCATLRATAAQCIFSLDAAFPFQLLAGNRRLPHSSRLGETCPTPAHAKHGAFRSPRPCCRWKPQKQQATPKSGLRLAALQRMRDYRLLHSRTCSITQLVLPLRSTGFPAPDDSWLTAS